MTNRIRWLPPLVLLVNVAVFGLFLAYGLPNLRPDRPGADQPGTAPWWMLFPAGLVALVPTVASMVFVWPILTWSRARRHVASSEAAVAIAYRAASTPLALATFSLATWLVVTAFVAVRTLTTVPNLSLGLGVHVVVRPVLAGVIAATATFFATESVCRACIWPVLLAGVQIIGNPQYRDQLRRV